MKSGVINQFKQLTEIYKYNLIAYLLLVFVLFITLRINYSFFYFDTSQYTLGNQLVSCLRSISDAVVISLPYCLLRKKHKALFFLFMFFLTNLLLLAGIWYYRNFETVIPYTAFLMPDNLNGLGPSILASMRWSDALVILPALLFIFVYYYFLSARIEECPFKKRALFFLFLLVIAVPVQLNAGWNNYIGCDQKRVIIFKHYGPFHIFRFDLQSHRPCNPAELEEIKSFLNRKKKNPEKHPATRKNLILILTESFTSWPIGLKINREEITPYLNRIVKQDGTIYFPHVLPQTNDGRSSDAQLIINTGLLPLRSGAAAMLFGTNNYYSIPKALAQKGYKSYNFICDEPEFWNQGTTTRSYGFNELFDKYKLGSTGKKLNDQQLFKAASEHLGRFASPFYAQIVTLSTHHPFQESTCLNHNELILGAGLPSKEVAYFLAAVQYTDRQIGQFIENLKKTDLYDQSIIIITGDHEDITYNQFKGKEKTSLSDRYVPLIILNSPAAMADQDAVAGQSDIYPTILDVMGVGDYVFTGVGNSLLEKNDDCAVFRTGEVAGESSQEEMVAKKKSIWRISDLIIRSDYFKR